MKILRFALPLAVLCAGFFLLLHPGQRPERPPYGVSFKSVANEKPDDWFFRQRAHPQGRIPAAAREHGFAQAHALQVEAADRQDWEPAGPTNIGGRITALAVHPARPDVIFAGAADGGVLRSSDGGTTWTPLSDALPSLSIGALAIDPTNPDLIYVGTGEANAAGDTYAGTGLYRSFDSGESWEWLGLPQSYKIGRIVIDPVDPQKLYVAVMGALYTTNPERGVYRSINGGIDWEQCLYVSDSTGVVDLAINPLDPSTLYAAAWERIRRPNDRRVGGLTSGVYRSTDGGDSWALLGGGLPGPSTTRGRIGLSLCATEPDVVYAIYADHPGYFDGIYKTANGGDAWSRVNDGALGDLYSSFGWYFGNIRVAPSDPDLVFALGVPLYRSANGGASWSDVSGITHVDHHALVIAPDDPSEVVNGNDGGVYLSTTTGNSWTKSYDLPISQFYAIGQDAQQPARLYGGTQDNGTMRTWSGGLDDWDRILGGDGFHVLVDHTDSYTIYAEYQWGWMYKSTDGGDHFYDALTGVNSNDRRNWSTPFAMDPQDHDRLLYGTYRLYETTNAAGYWSAISGDLTGGPGSGALTYGTITTLAIAPTDGDRIYVGTDDAHVWTTPNGGDDWIRIDGDLPDRWITRVAVDPIDPEIAYVTLSGFRLDEFMPHIFRTTDAGATWSDISANLPELPLNDVVIDPLHPSTLIVASDAGVYASKNTGASWFAVGATLPNSAVVDLLIEETTRTIVAGTHGRSMFRYDLENLMSAAPEHDPSRAAALRISRVAPNPLATGGGSVTIAFEGAHTGAAQAELLILSPTGRLLRRLSHPSVERGIFIWDGRDEAGHLSPAGTYLLRLEAGAQVAAGRIQVLP